MKVAMQWMIWFGLVSVCVGQSGIPAPKTKKAKSPDPRCEQLYFQKGNSAPALMADGFSMVSNASANVNGPHPGCDVFVCVKRGERWTVLHCPNISATSFTTPIR